MSTRTLLICVLVLAIPVLAWGIWNTSTGPYTGMTIRVVGGTSGNALEVDATGHLLTTGGTGGGSGGAPSGPAGGGLTGTYPDPTLANPIDSVALRDKGGMVYNVKAYGAVGDGVTDDTAAFQAVAAAAPDGSILFVPGGTYIIGTITMTGRKGITWAGTGGKSILKRKVAGINTAAMLDLQGDGNEDITIRDLTFDINNCVSYCGGVKLGNTIRYRILHNNFIDSNVNTANFNDKYGVVVSTTGIVADGLILGNQFIDTTLEVDNSSNVYIAFNTVVRGRSTCGIGIFSQSPAAGHQVRDVTIVYNTVRDSHVAAGAITVENDPPAASGYSWRNIKIAHNLITYGPLTATHGEGRAIQVGTASASTATTGITFEDLTIENNTILFDPAYVSAAPRGIFANTSLTANFVFSRLSVQGNKIVLPTMGGTGMSISYATEGIIANNAIWNPTGVHAVSLATLTNTVMRDNIIYGGNTTLGYEVTASTMILYGNHQIGAAATYTFNNTPATNESSVIYDRKAIEPVVQTIASGGTVGGDACGGVKQITAAGPVTTNGSDTFRSPALGTTQCVMDVCNVGTNTITLDSNTNFVSAANVILTARACVRVGSTGTAWYQLAPVQLN